MSDNVIDPKNNISLDQFYRCSYQEIEEITQVNPDCDIEVCKVEKLEYLKIRNFLKNPVDLRNFLINFPAEDLMKTLVNGGENVRGSKSPGFQQVMNAFWFKSISKSLHDIMEKNKLVHYGWSPPLWEFYTNCIYSGMKSYRLNYRPHLDQFKYAGNIYLTDVEDTGTSFYKFIGDEKEYYTNQELFSSGNSNDVLKYKSSLDSYVENSSDVTPWPYYSGDKDFAQYHKISADFNSVSLYKGKYWHSVYFRSDVPNTIRYSLVAVLR